MKIQHYFIRVDSVRKSMVWILDINDLNTYNRHVDQIQFQGPGDSVPISVVNSNTNEHIIRSLHLISSWTDIQ